MPRSIESELAALRAKSLLRRVRDIEPHGPPVILLNGRPLVNFASNDYLGLAGEEFLREAARDAVSRYGVGSGSARLISGTSAPHLHLEERLAAFKQTDAALAFSSGYAAAVGTIGALLRSGDVAVMDKLCHASLIDGARLSGALIRVYPHNHLGKLESHLRWARDHHPDGRLLVITESVFSMDGDQTPLADLIEIKERYGAMLLLDEAHAIGVLGENGRGLAAACGLAGRVEAQMGTLGKALGVSGGYIAGSRLLIDLIINRARSFIYSTAPPPALAAAASAALDFLASDAGEQRRRTLWENIGQFATQIPAGLAAAPRPESAICPILLGGEDLAIAAARWLAEKGFFVPAIRYPTVAKGAARLRVTLSAIHTSTQITALSKALTELRTDSD